MRTNVQRPNMIRPDEWKRFCDYALANREHARRAEDGTLIFFDPITGCEDASRLTVQHIVSRHQIKRENPHLQMPLVMATANQPTNLAIKTWGANCSLGCHVNSPEWGRLGVFDQVPALDNLRASQQLVWDRIQEFASFFAEPIPQWSGRLLTWAMKTGAGKTVAKAILPCAINYAIKTTWGSLLGRPRVRKLLVVAKDSNSRDQLAAEMELELVQHNILENAPTVRRVSGLAKLDEATRDTDVGIVVCCIQTLWPKDPNTQREYFAPEALECLHRCQVICFDEMHWGRQKIFELVNAAEYSACFGFTATPIDSLGEVFSQIVLCGVYGRDKAIEYDGSMSEIDKHHSLLIDRLDELEAVNTHIDVDGNYLEADSIEDVRQYKVEIERVAKNVVESMYRLDHLSTEELGIVSEHRHRQTASVQPWTPRTHDMLTEQIVKTFPVHAIIRVSRIATIEALELAIQRYLDANRNKFPAEHGWNASSVYGGRKLDMQHRWMRFLKTGIMDYRCARILVVDQMAQENTNNRYCGINAYAKPVPPLAATVQGNGRTERSMHIPGTNIVPPAKLDRSYIVTSSYFDPNDTIDLAIDFSLNMEEQILCCNPETLDDFVTHRASDSPWLIDEDDSVGLRLSSRLLLIKQMGQWQQNEPDESPKIWSWAAMVTTPPTTVTTERSRWPRAFKAAFEFCELWINGNRDVRAVIPDGVYETISRMFACGDSVAEVDLQAMVVAEHGHRNIVDDLEIRDVVDEARHIDDSGRGFANIFDAIPNHPAVLYETREFVRRHHRAIDRGAVDCLQLEPMVEQTVSHLARGMDARPSYAATAIRPAVRNAYAQVAGVSANMLYSMHPKREAAVAKELQVGTTRRQIAGKAFFSLLEHENEATSPFSHLILQGAQHANER